VSPLLDQCFYRRQLDPRATNAVPLAAALDAVMKQLSSN